MQNNLKKSSVSFSNSTRKNTTRLPEIPRNENLKSYLANILKFTKESKGITMIDDVFKVKSLKRYIQTRTQTFNGGAQVIFIATDITNIKKVKKQAKKLRSIFFSSVAHELRTPLNSIIPIVRMIIMNLEQQEPNENNQKLMKYLIIILNSSLHLQSVIEDALDMSRLENNKFQILLDMFNIRQAVNEVSQIMNFQI